MEQAFVSGFVESHRGAGLKTHQLFLTPSSHKQLVSILTSTLEATRGVGHFCEIKSKSNLHTGPNPEGFCLDLTVLFCKKLHLNFSENFVFQ